MIRACVVLWCVVQSAEWRKSAEGHGARRTKQVSQVGVVGTVTALSNEQDTKKEKEAVFCEYLLR